MKRRCKRRGVTGEQMLQILETRLDNVVYHLGFANTRAAARQMVAHGHVQREWPQGRTSLPTPSR